MKKIILSTFSLFQFISFSQTYNPKSINYEMDLVAPLKINMVLAGNFCEMRSNHFHTGLDIKTDKVVGKKIYAIADGYISRIRVSPWGYGNALYIQHNNGLTSLYAHCLKFTPKIDSLVYQIQKNQENAIVDKSVIELKIPVKKGELIAYSGNSGSSSAPHLHFEIRETLTENPINPLLFKCYQKLITDTTPPQIRGVKFYTITNNGYMIPGKSKYFGVANIKGKLIINKGKPINIDELLVENSKLAIGVHTIDQLDGARNICGVYNIKTSKNNQLIHEQKTEYMNFDHNRFMNSHKDYNAFKKERKHIHKQFTTNINPLPIYPLNNGKINWIDRDGTYNITIYDMHNNKTDFEFVVSSNLNTYQNNIFKDNKKYIYPDTVNYIIKENLQVLFESGTFYEPLEIIYKSKIADSIYNFLSPIYSFADYSIPVQKKYDIRIKYNNNSANLPTNKLCIVYLDLKNRIHYVGGTYFNNWIETSVRSFGKFGIMIDTLPPIIKPYDYKKNKIISKYNTLELTIKDNLSGVKSYKAYINNNWVLMYYNRKKGRYIIPLDNYSKPYLTKGENAIKIISYDKKDNKSEHIETVIY